MWWKRKEERIEVKKVSLPNDVAPIIVVPHENESKIIVEDDTLDDDIASLSYGTMSDGIIEDDFIIPITCCDNYDWEDSDTSYNLEIFLAPTWKIMMIIIAILLVLFIL